MSFISTASHLIRNVSFNQLSDTVTIKVFISQVNEFQKLAEDSDLLDKLSEDMDKQGNWYFFRCRMGMVL